MKTKQIMAENVVACMDHNCNINIAQLANFGLEHGDLSEIEDESILFTWAWEIKSQWERNS